MEETESLSPRQQPSVYHFKSKLFTYTQKHGLHAPDYHFQNEGFQHAPCVRVTVDVAGRTFTSPKTFRRRKDAEHFISQLAFESLSHQAPVNVPTTFLKGSKLCKSILHEYCVKNGMMMFPIYDTKVPESGPCTMFFSEVEFDNNTFVGSLSRSKKDAEQCAACVVIISLLEKSETRCLMSEVIQTFVSATAARAGCHVGSDKEPAEVAENNSPVWTGLWTEPNNTCKSILKEYLDMKGYLDQLQYKTHADESGPLQAYVSSVSLDGNTYNGPPSKSKKEAEQATARVAINSILVAGNPVSKYFMLQAIQSYIKPDPSWDGNLISNPSANLNSEVNATLHQLSPNPEAKTVGDCSVTPEEPLQGTSTVRSAVGQGGEKVENLSPPVGSSKNARKRARRKAQNLVVKKAKMTC